MEREDFWLIAAFQGAKMRQKSGLAKKPAKQIVKDIRRAIRRQFSAEEKIRIARPPIYYGEARYGAPLGPKRRRLGWIRYQSREDEAPRRRPRLWIAAGDPAGISRFSLLKRRAVSVSSKGRRLPRPRGMAQTPFLNLFWRLAIVDLIIAHSDFPSLSRAYR
jgi:hypothetical protein